MQEDRVSFPSPGEAHRSGEAEDRGRARPEPGGFTGLSAAAGGETLSPMSAVAFRNASLAGSPLGRRVGKPLWALGDSASGQLCPLGRSGGGRPRRPGTPFPLAEPAPLVLAGMQLLLQEVTSLRLCLSGALLRSFQKL